MNTPNANIPYRLCTALLAVLCIQDVSARCGSVDYSWGADGLAEATAFVGTMMIYTVEILYAVAGIVVIVDERHGCLLRGLATWTSQTLPKSIARKIMGTQ